MGDTLGHFQKGFETSYQAALKKKAAEAEQGIKDEEAAATDAKNIKAALKVKVDTYKKRADTIAKDAEEGSALYKWNQNVNIGADNALMYLENPELSNDFDVSAWMRMMENDYEEILTTSGDIATAKIHFPDDTDEYFGKLNEIDKTNADKSYKEKVFKNLDSQDQKTVVKNHTNIKKVIDSGVYDTYQGYIGALRKQFELEDKLVSTDPAIKAELENIKRELKKYDAALLWSSFKNQNPNTSGIKAIKVEDFGTFPVFKWSPEMEKDYNNLLQQYTAIFKTYTGFDVAWNPIPVSFEPVYDDSGNIKHFSAKDSSSPNTVMWTGVQLKDRNDIIEYAAAGHIYKDIELLTGMKPIDFNNIVDSILTNPETTSMYNPSFVSSLSELDSLMSIIDNELDLDPKDLTYTKTNFLLHPVPSEGDTPGASDLTPYIQTHPITGEQFASEIPKSNLDKRATLRKVDQPGQSFRDTRDLKVKQGNQY